MKVIVNRFADLISASSENPNYPAANLLDEHPKRKWMAADNTVLSAVLTVSSHGITGGMAFVGVVADQIAVEITDPAGITWQNVAWQNVTWNTVPEGISMTKEFVHNDSYSALWVEFPEFDGPVSIVITLSKDPSTADTLSAGVLVVGQFYEIPGLEYPLQEGLQDYSIIRELSNGATYRKRRDIVRTFSGTILNDRVKFFWVFMRDICRVNGTRPMMWKLCDIDGEFIVYGRLANMPTGSHDYFEYSRQNFELIEVL